MAFILDLSSALAVTVWIINSTAILAGVAVIYRAYQRGNNDGA